MSQHRPSRATAKWRAGVQRAAMADPDRPTWPQGSDAIVTDTDGKRWNTITASLAFRVGDAFMVHVEGSMAAIPCERVAIGPHDPELRNYRDRHAQRGGM